MRSRVIIGAVLILGLVGIATLAASALVPTKHSALVDFTRPTIIAGTIVSGKVVFAHDDDKMANGQPCTTVYQYVQGGQGKKLVEFMCQPIQQARTEHFTARCSRATLSGPDVLTEYQFAGDTESHGVPWRP